MVEDNSTDAYVIHEAIKATGMALRFQLVRDGQEALRILENPTLGCPALLILDLNLPKVNGVEVLRQVRRSSRCARVPVIVVTSSAAYSDRAAVEHLGADAYFLKPLDLAGYLDLTPILLQVLEAGS